MSLDWDQKARDTAVRILSSHSAQQDALLEISQSLNHHITYDSLRRAFSRHGLGKPASYLKQHPINQEIHPVRQQEIREQTTAERRAIDQLTRELREANKRNDFFEKVSATHQPPRIPRREKSSGIREATAVALASDWHVEEQVDPESIAGRNSYNLEIASHRVDRFFNAVAWNIEHQRASNRIAIRDLVLWLGGDLMSGYIHEELIEANNLSPTETILWLLPRLRGGIKMLSERLALESIVIPCSFGNHGRTTKKPRISTGPQNSYEWLMYHNLQRELESEKSITFEITKSAHQYVGVYDFRLHFHHGDDVNYQGGIGGLGIPLLKAVPAWDDIQFSDIHNIGHWHQLRNYGRAMVNGSLIGYGPYSQRIRAPFEEPKQMFYLMDSKRAQCMWTPLWVGEEPRQGQEKEVRA